MRKSQLSIIVLYCFFVISIINLLEQIIKLGWLDMTTKPLLMIALLVHYLLGRNGKMTRLTRYMTAALLFSWGGDVLLMLQGSLDNIFILGLASFLIAHVFYIFSYKLAVNEDSDNVNKSFIRTRIAFLIFIGGALLYLLYPYLGDLLLPVVLYTLVIITMGIFALIRRGWTIEKSFIMVYSGALLFIMSDALLAINKFMNPIIQARLLIMATYIAAQFLIVRGIMLHENAAEEEPIES